MDKAVDPLGTMVGAIIVHHKSYSSIAKTLQLIQSGGVSRSRIVIVDNSEEPTRRNQLEQAIPAEVKVLFRENNGYGAAVNAGVAELMSTNNPPPYILVSTHECRPEIQAIRFLYDALSTRPDAAVAGPTLVTGEDGVEIWSTGGLLTRLLRLPRHFGHGSAWIPTAHKPSVDREWLDGAFLLFRSSAIAKFPIDETYFMYMEEVDHQLSLKQVGWAKIWVPSAVVWQSSGGIPPYYLARNMVLFQDRHGNAVTKFVTPIWAIFHRILSNIVKRRGGSEARELYRGWIDGLKARSKRINHVTVVNPLAAALYHYEKELCSVLEEIGSATRVLRINEPSVSGSSRLVWILRYLGLILRARISSPSSKIIVLWPPVGYLDMSITRIIGGPRTMVVVHDPVPLVHAIGFDMVSRKLAGLLGRNRLITHSRAASNDVMNATGLRATVVAHPILPYSPPLRQHSLLPVVRVVGQYKPDRDLDALVAVGEIYRDKAKLEITGRGWPEVPGWTVNPIFVAEEEFQDLLTTADVVLIPYTRFYQSGVAIRCLEVGTPFVGPGVESLTALVGAGSPLLVNHGDENLREEWSAAIQSALEYPRSSFGEAADRVRLKTVEGWRELVVI